MSFQKVYLLFRVERDNRFPDEVELCDIFTTEARAQAERDEREETRGNQWVSYRVEEWEIQE